MSSRLGDRAVLDAGGYVPSYVTYVPGRIKHHASCLVVLAPGPLMNLVPVGPCRRRLLRVSVMRCPRHLQAHRVRDSPSSK